ncbi:MAG: DUF5698 domain-containing protein [Acidimicrobiia bacterium]
MLELAGAAAIIIALRIADVSLGTIRIILLSRGSRWRSALVSFFESLIWVIGFAVVIRDLDDPARMVAYATGYALGTFVGAALEQRLAIGTVAVQAMAPVASPSSAEALRAAGFAVTEMNGEGRDGAVRIVTTVIPRRKLKTVTRIIEEANPAAFVTTGFVGLNGRRRASVRK